MTITNGYIVDDVGGGIVDDGALSLDDVIVSHSAVVQSNPALSEPYGGGIYSGGSLTMTNSQVFDNVAFSRGAGICILEGTTTHLTKVLIESNSISGTGGNGGGIYLESKSGEPSILTLDQVTLSYNNAEADGGGLYAQPYATVTINNSTINSNTAPSYGAGIYSDQNTTLNMTNDTVTWNMASGGYAGGIFIYGSATLTNVTVAGNSAYIVGGVQNYGSGVVNLSNTIISGNTASASSPDCAGTLNSLDYNLIQNDTTCIISGTTTHYKAGVSANLATLAMNGGPTATMALLPGSPAIDAGNDAVCAAAPVGGLDQRGIARPKGFHCDMGAYEAILFLIKLPLVIR
jgi:hypothetical protein